MLTKHCYQAIISFHYQTSQALAMKTACLLLSLVIFLLAAWAFQQQVPHLLLQIKQLGWLAPLLFLLIYCLATLLFLPTMVLTLAGGVLFGPITGTVLNLTGATIGASCAFWISRYYAYDWFVTNIGRKTQALITRIEQRGWQFVALLRLIPLVPFNLVNYGLGMTHMKFSHYLVTTILFLAPGEVIYTYCGYAGMDVLTNQHSPYSYPKIILISAGVLLLLLSIVARRFSKQAD